jgi:hypothetical protein
VERGDCGDGGGGVVGVLRCPPAAATLGSVFDLPTFTGVVFDCKLRVCAGGGTGGGTGFDASREGGELPVWTAAGT